MRVLLVALFVPLIMTAVVLTSYLSYRNGQRAIADVSNRLCLEIAAHIEGHLKSFLTAPVQINRINADALRSGWLPIEAPTVLERHFWKQAKVFDSATSIYFGNTAGGLADAGREYHGGDLYVISTDKFKSGPFRKYATDGMGNRTSLLAIISDFDARQRPWYQGAVDKGTLTWSDVYVLFTGHDMAISASLPVRDDNEKLLGVVSVDLSLAHLGAFLQSMQFGKTGIGFIVERSGLLIASSTPEKPFSEAIGGNARRRFFAYESLHPLIRNAARQLGQHLGGFKNMTGPKQMTVTIGDQRYFIQASPARIDSGPDWLIVVVIPESDFMAPIHANNRTTSLLILATLVVAIFLGALAARRISQPIRHLKCFAQALAQGHRVQPVPEQARIKEIGELTQSFNQMARQLGNNMESLMAEITDRKQTEKALRESEERLELVLKGADLGLWDWNLPTGEVVFNERWAQMLGYTLSEIHPHVSTWEAAIHPDDLSSVTMALNDHLEGRTPIYRAEHRLRTKSGKWRWIADVGKVFVRDEKGSPVRVVGIHEDIEERKQGETRLRKTLKEKEVLLQEIHHRVKNNLAVVLSLLNLQSKRTGDDNVRKSLMESQARVRAMALIHESFYQNKDLSLIHFEEYVRKLVRDLQSLYEGADSRIEVIYDIQGIELEVGQAVSCGLVINELMTNVLKHAFPDKREGEVKISARIWSDGKAELQIRDNGIGLPPGMEWERSGTLGLRLVSLMVEQLSGTWRIENTGGVEVTIQWDIKSSRTA